MIIQYNPDEHITVTTHNVCSYHKSNPNKSYAGCTCISSYSLRKATRDEQAENKKRRLIQRKIELLTELEAIERELD